MDMPSRIDKLERGPKSFAKACRIVPHYLKATALLRTIKREGRNDSVPSNLQGPPKPRDVRRTIIFFG